MSDTDAENALEDEMHEAYGAMIHRGRVESEQALPEPKLEPLPNRTGHVPKFKPGTPRLFIELRNARIKNKIPRKIVAHNAGIHHAHLGMLETGQCSPSLATTIAWANALGYELVVVKK
jgi:DNA-binding XRE family transcriptional regulator